MKNFISVTTNAARFQDISLNPQKLAGMCAKLKCCLNYEVDNYMEAGRRMPPRDVVLQTQDADYFFFKADILAGLVTYSTDKRAAVNLEVITAERAKEVIELNKQGEKPLSLQEEGFQREDDRPKDLLEDDISRFDKAKKKKKKRKGKGESADAQPSRKEPQAGKPKGEKGERPEKSKGEKGEDGAQAPQAPKGDGKPKGGERQQPKNRPSRKTRQGKGQEADPSGKAPKEKKSEPNHE